MQSTRHTTALILAFIINTVLTVIEYAAAFVSGSAAITADGSQNLTDSLVLSIAFISERLVTKRAVHSNVRHRIYRITGSLNAIILICLACFIGFLAINRIIHPPALNTTLVMVVGTLSIIINGAAAGLLFAARRGPTIRAPYIGLVFSGISGVGVLLSGIIEQLWGFRQTDGIIGLIIASLLLIRSTRLLLVALR